MDQPLDRRHFLICAGSASLLCVPGGVGRVCGGEPNLSDQRPGTGPGSAAQPSPKVAVPSPYYWAWWGWEPLDHYHRAGGNAGAVDGHAPWLPQWFDRLHREETVRTMTEVGVNLAVTHFFKGFGLKHERAAQEQTAQLVRLAHQHGLHVLGYCQSRSLYYETFLAEEPQAAQWTQRDPLGQPMTWGGAYYRWAPCMLSPEFRQYLKRVIRVGLEEIGLDGLHFDNDYAEPCYCQRCLAAFRAWLTEHYPNPRELFGLASFTDVRLPPPAASAARIQDPLVQAWVRFRCESLGDYHRDLTTYARSLRPNVILLGNPAHPRSLDGPYKRSVWAPLVGRHLNLMFAENGNFPGLVDGTLISQIRAYKQAAAVGYRVISTTWQRGRETGQGLPETAEQVGLQVAEAAAFGGIPGTNWALRPLGDGDRMRIDRPDLRAALGRSLRFVRTHEQLLAAARPVRDVAVFHSFASLAFDAQQTGPVLLGTEETLIRGGFAWEVVFGDDLSRLDAFATLIVAGQAWLSDRECAALQAAAKRGAGLVLIGENATCDEHGRQRLRNPLDDLSGPGVVRVEDRLAWSPIDAGYTVRVPLSKGWKQLADAVQRAGRDRFSVRLHDGDTVALSAYETGQGQLAVHLVNYAAPLPRQGLWLALGPRWKTASRATLLAADEPQQTLPIAHGTLEIPPLPLYALVIVEPG